MKNLYIILILLTSAIGFSQCITNGNFESGLADYTFTESNGGFTITDCSVDTSQNFQAITPSLTNNNFNADVTLISVAQGAVNDPILLASNPSVSLSGISTGNNAIKLNQSPQNGTITTMSRNFTAVTNIISFNFSLIVEDGHPGDPQSQPFFAVRIYNGNEIVNNNEFCIVADENNPIFSMTQWISNPQFPQYVSRILYTGWECGRIAIPDELIGENLRIEFIMADCGQTGHHGTVYIDDITCDEACTNPAFPFVELYPINHSCPTAIFEVCGTYYTTEDGSLDDIELNILQNGIVVESFAIPTFLDDDTFCFEINPTVFGPNPIGQYEIEILADISVGSFVYSTFDSSAVSGADISYNGLDPSNANVVGDFLIWDDNAESYTLEFISDSACCPGAAEIPTVYFTTTLFTNQIDLSDVVDNLNGAKCFRWRIKTSECPGWSQWCCLAIDQPEYNFPPDANFGNALAPECYDGEIELCEPTLTVTVPVTIGNLSFEQRQLWIVALNTIENGSEAIYQAGQFIELEPGFQTETGAQFLARIEGCLPQANLDEEIANRINADPAREMIYMKELSTPISGFTVYPNPANHYLTIVGNSAAAHYTVVDISGKVLLHFNNTNLEKEITVDIQDLSAGVYFILADGNPVQKIIKN